MTDYNCGLIDEKQWEKCCYIPYHTGTESGDQHLPPVERQARLHGSAV